MMTPFIPTLLHGVGLTPEAAASSSILNINAGPTQSSLFSTGRKRPHDEISGLDEEAYARKHLASEASVFFRRRERSPRNILWRVLEDRRLLEVQSVDSVQTKQLAKDESTLTFRVSFPAAIVQGGIALADSQIHDALDIFALTSNHELYTFTLKRELLARDAPPKDFDSSKCIAKQTLSSLSFRRPYKLAVVSATELLISLHDGGLLRLEREGPTHNTSWKEVFYSEGGWTGTLRGLIPLKRHQTVRFGDVDLEPSAATSMAKSPDGQLLWTVTLDHEMVAWSIASGKVVSRKDLMGRRHDTEEKRAQMQYIMPAEQGDLLQIMNNDQPASDSPSAQLVATGQPYQIIVYSPKERAFKLFHARTVDTDTGEVKPQLRDILEGEILALPFDDLLNTNLWRCTGFRCKTDAAWSKTQFWVQVQSSAMNKLLTITLDLFTEDGPAADWQQKWQSAWTLVAAQSHDALPPLASEDRSTPIKRWLAFLLYPGRFSQASLETALHIYRQRRKLPSLSSKSLRPEQSFEERLCTAVNTNLNMADTRSERTNFQAYYKTMEGQWLGYFSILHELHLRRLEIKDFAFDMEEDLAWVVHADFIAPVQAADTIVRLDLNANYDMEEQRFERLDEELKTRIVKSEAEWDNMKLLVAVKGFANALPKAFQQKLAEISVSQAIDPPTVEDRAQAFFDSLDVGQHVTDETYQSLELALQPLNGIGGLTNDMILSLVKALSTPGQRGTKTDYALNRYGSKLMIVTAQNLIRQNKHVLLDLLALVAFVNNDFEAEALDSEFDAGSLYNGIMVALKHAELRDWLTRTACLEPSRSQLILSTVFESLFIGDWDAHAPKNLALVEKLTHWSRQWAFAKFNDWHGFTANIFSTLLRHGMIDLAAEFVVFLQESPWTMYLQARLHLVLGNVDEAVFNFRAAADGLSERVKGDLDTAGLLTAEELSHFGEGKEMYHLHIATLFEKQRFYASTADFAGYALEFIDGSRLQRDLEALDAKKKSDQSPAETVANARAEVRVLKTRSVWEELVSLQFKAFVQTGRFVRAFEALKDYKTPELQRADLQRLIDTCSKSGMLDVILELQFDDMADAADAVLLALAKKSMNTGVAMRPEQQVLYAFRTRRGDYRGAAQVLHEHLERLKHHGRRSLHDPEDETLLHAYLILINTLACCGEGEGWLLSDPIEGVHPASRRRKLITLEDVRREYVAELDKRSDLQHGRFPLVGGDDDDDMDVL